MAGVLIDSSVFIAAERGTLDIEARLSRSLSGQHYISPMVLSELLVGLHKAGASEHARARREFIGYWQQRFPLIPIDAEVAERHAALNVELQRQGVVIGPHDLWLAATCLAHGLSIATLNLGEFRRVPGLVVEDWAA